MLFRVSVKKDLVPQQWLSVKYLVSCGRSWVRQSRSSWSPFPISKSLVGSFPGITARWHSGWDAMHSCIQCLAFSHEAAQSVTVLLCIVLFLVPVAYTRIRKSSSILKERNTWFTRWFKEVYACYLYNILNCFRILHFQPHTSQISVRPAYRWRD